MQEPGLDEHEWTSRWVALQPELADAPAEALPEVDRLIAEILAERGYDEGVDPEIDRELEQAREIVERLETGGDVDPGDLGAAVAGYRAIYEQILAERRAP